MTSAFDLLTTAAFLLLVLAGFASLVGATTLRARLVKMFAGALLLAFVGLPALSTFLHRSHEVARELHVPAVPGTDVDWPTGLVPAVIFGHVVAAILVLRRYVGTDGRRLAAAERERARTRERVRLPASGDEGES